MVMALSIVAENSRLQIAAGFESGHTMVFMQSDPGAMFQRLYCAHPHTQPGLPPWAHRLNGLFAKLPDQSSPWPFPRPESVTSHHQRMP